MSVLVLTVKAYVSQVLEVDVEVPVHFQDRGKMPLLPSNGRPYLHEDQLRLIHLFRVFDNEWSGLSIDFVSFDEARDLICVFGSEKPAFLLNEHIHD